MIPSLEEIARQRGEKVAIIAQNGLEPAFFYTAFGEKQMEEDLAKENDGMTWN